MNQSKRFFLEDFQSIADDYNDKNLTEKTNDERAQSDIMAQPPVQFNIIEDSNTARQNDDIINFLGSVRNRTNHPISITQFMGSITTPNKNQVHIRNGDTAHPAPNTSLPAYFKRGDTTRPAPDASFPAYIRKRDNTHPATSKGKDASLPAYIRKGDCTHPATSKERNTHPATSKGRDASSPAYIRKGDSTHPATSKGREASLPAYFRKLDCTHPTTSKGRDASLPANFRKGDIDHPAHPDVHRETPMCSCGHSSIHGIQFSVSPTVHRVNSSALLNPTEIKENYPFNLSQYGLRNLFLIKNQIAIVISRPP